MCMDQLVHALVLTYATTDVRVARPESLVDVVRYPEPTDIPRRLATVWVYAPHQGSKVSRPRLRLRGAAGPGARGVATRASHGRPRRAPSACSLRCALPLGFGLRGLSDGNQKKRMLWTFIQSSNLLSSE